MKTIKLIKLLNEKFFIGIIFSFCLICSSSSKAEKTQLNGLDSLTNGIHFNDDSHATIDVLRFSQAIDRAIKMNTNRSGFVKNVMESAFYQAGQIYNVMVFNKNQHYEEHFEGIQFHTQVTYEDIVYEVWVFEKGSFKNQGDGGYINWAFKGWFNRSGSFVEFTLP